MGIWVRDWKCGTSQGGRHRWWGRAQAHGEALGQEMLTWKYHVSFRAG
jgi:hypothetical protein